MEVMNLVDESLAYRGVDMARRARRKGIVVRGFIDSFCLWRSM